MEKWQDGPLVTSNLFEHIVTHRSLKDIDTFVAPTWPGALTSPFDLPDMTKACDRIWQAIQSRESIGIMGDYDMDGTPAAAVLASFLSLFSIKPYIILPTREQGYGFSETQVQRFLDAQVSLIVTVDCGVRDYASITLATAQKCDVIVTDHHECPSELPPAYAILNPKRPDSRYPFPSLCGTGVVFRLIQALIATAPVKEKDKIPAAFAEWMLDLVAIATIADMVSLQGENRTFVYFGLKVLKQGKRPGLRQLITALNLSLDSLDYSDIAYRIIPKCNACGRIDNMDDVYALLTEKDNRKIEAAIRGVIRSSMESQRLFAIMLESAEKLVSAEVDSQVVVVSSDDWHPGLTGLVASRLVESLDRPVAVLAGQQRDYLRGSMRSIPGVNLVHMLEQVSETIERFGGHEGAAGLTIHRTALPDFKRALASIPLPSSKITLTTDGTIEPHQASLDSLEALSKLKPWGVGNTEPLWGIRNIQLTSPKWLSEGKHLKVAVECGQSALDVIFFNAETIRDFLAQSLDICGNVTINEFRGTRRPQFQIRSFRGSNRV